MASQKAFAHRPGAFAPTGRTQQQQAFTQQQTFTVPQQLQPVAPPIQPQPQMQPQAIPGFDAQLAAEDPYYAAYIQQQQQAQLIPNRGAQSAQEAFQMSQDYVANLKAQYDEANDCAKFNMTTEEALKNKQQLRQMVDEFAQQLQYQGMTIDQYFEYSGNDRDKMMEVMAPQAEKRILTRLVLEQIVKEENITVSEEDFEEELQKLAASYGADLDTVKNIFVGKERERMEEDIAVQKAVSFVADHAVEVEKAEEAAETEEA